MSLSCSCDGDSYTEVYREKLVRARKAHVCHYCKNQIKIGETYSYIFAVYEGDAYSEHNCERCADLAETLLELGFCWGSGELREAYVEYLREYTNSIRYDEVTGEELFPRNHLTVDHFKTY